MPSLIISEFINAFSKLDFNMKSKENPGKYKNYKRDYRDTEEYNKLLNVINSTVQKIMKYCCKINDDFINISLKDIFSNKNKFDYNDKYFIEMAKSNNLKIVTNDSDFIVPKNVYVITANNRLI
jgi:predicted nucleic acid-binding protein